MKVNKKQKAEIEKHLIKISTMGKQELLLYAQKFHMAKQDLDQTVFKWVARGFDVQLMHLQEVSNQSAKVVMSELKGLGV